jgi:hypothetical protein
MSAQSPLEAVISLVWPVSHWLAHWRAMRNDCEKCKVVMQWTPTTLSD